MPTSPRIRPLASEADAHWCATLMASSDPWITLQRDYAKCRTTIDGAEREVHLAVGPDDERLGLVVLALTGPFAGYLQCIAVAPDHRGQGIGEALLAFTEARIAQVSPNVFLCVSSFNPRARRLYERCGYQYVGTLTDFVVAGHDEHLMRKTIGPWGRFTPASR